MSVYKLMVKEQEMKYKTFRKAAEKFLSEIGEILSLNQVTIDDLENIKEIKLEIEMEKVVDVLSKEELSRLFPTYLETYLQNEYRIGIYASWLYAKIEIKKDSFVLSVDLSNIIFGLRGDEEGKQRDFIIKAIKEMKKNFFNVNVFSLSTATFFFDNISEIKVRTVEYSLISIGFEDVKVELLEKNKESQKEEENYNVKVSFKNKYSFKKEEWVTRIEEKSENPFGFSLFLL